MGWEDVVVMSPKPGSRFRVGHALTGRTLTAVPGRMIVRTWRGGDWKKSEADSVLILTFERAPRGGRMRMVHANVPDRRYRGIVTDGPRTTGSRGSATSDPTHKPGASTPEGDVIMSEKDQFLSTMAREVPTTMRVLKAYPAGKGDLKPHAKLKSARELAWTFVTEMKASGQALDGALELGKMPPPPATLQDVISTYEQSAAALVERLKRMPDAELNTTVKFFTAPKQMGDVRKMDVLWFMLMDSVHHRGQFSVYLRMADGKVPSIYGPSADEPWM
jgi:uncharacterized damage-inducible protein DinB